ncbi:MAG: DUF167 family protein [Thiohalobacteraceae bacterium]
MRAPLPRWYRWEGTDLVLALHVQPGARRDEIVGTHGDRLKVRITAPPIEGKANQHLIRFLAEVFGVPASNVELLSGGSGREKRLRVHNPRRLPSQIPPSAET